MRQKGLSQQDAEFRTALENMRFARCTKDDVALLLTRVHDPVKGGAELHSDRFREVPIITAFNAYRDAINADRVREYARARNVPLVSFYSSDLWGKNKDGASIRQAQKAYDAVVDPVRQSNIISPRIQEALWNIPPTLSGHHPGVLHLCVGMPVILKYNEATELCATNGAAARVVKWDAHRMPCGKLTLDTLFVELTNPPRPVQLPGLPPNVIPLTKTKKTVLCILPAGDIAVYVQREQVMVLPNFAVTDFACQGQTRTDNVCHLKYCKNHQSIYTCLSRSSSLAGTLILDTFDTSKITCGASSSLRREFRELELLDYITQSSITKTLPATVHGNSRAALLASFSTWKGHRFVPPNVHPALDWSDAPTSELTPSIDTSRAIAALSADENAANSQRGTKRPPTENWLPSRAPKRRNAQAPNEDSTSSSHDPVRYGVPWDRENWSCGYDAALTILWNLYIDLGDEWLEGVAPGNVLLTLMRQHFPTARRIPAALELCRNLIRDVLYTASPQSYPRHGERKVSAAEVLYLLLTCPTPYSRASSTCSSCGATNTNVPRMSDSYVWILGDPLYRSNFPDRSSISAQEYVNTLLNSGYPWCCTACGEQSPTVTTLLSAPPLIVLESLASGTLIPDDEIRALCQDKLYTWRLAGAVYFGWAHFTSRYFDQTGSCWFHDGAVTGRYCIPDTASIHHPSTLLSSRARLASHYVYVLLQ
ncbi:hypothetical protein OH76DRAFT_1338348 [Lentinus brumalis]|uniref:Uncharacterized protein n=1 Tax=Lentinus brumalis TaxID=2498619 RepID=A0A371DUD8_9APHY|nr:hypothetical protein OH76DRAFT_1338348 [Polyporus brumalis]